MNLESPSQELLISNALNFWEEWTNNFLFANLSFSSFSCFPSLPWSMPFTKQPQGGCRDKMVKLGPILRCLIGDSQRRMSALDGTRLEFSVWNTLCLLCLAFRNFPSIISLGTVMFPHFIDEKWSPEKWNGFSRLCSQASVAWRAHILPQQADCSFHRIPLQISDFPSPQCLKGIQNKWKLKSKAVAEERVQGHQPCGQNLSVTLPSTVGKWKQTKR